MTIQRLRPEVKPDYVSYGDWKRSKCTQSPTGSHWFVPGSGGELQCYFCEKSHPRIGDRKPAGRPRGRPRLKTDEEIITKQLEG